MLKTQHRAQFGRIEDIRNDNARQREGPRVVATAVSPERQLACPRSGDTTTLNEAQKAVIPSHLELLPTQQ